jgi:hypothetical protein
MFEVAELVAACVACLDESDVRRAVYETLERAVDRPEAVAHRLRPERAGITWWHDTPRGDRGDAREPSASRRPRRTHP